MILIDQHTKAIMEECKARARDAGLSFGNETLEYIVTNRDLIELSPKVMIPTLYDYWVNDVEVLKGAGKYKLFPSNPYETVINSRPAISYYNDNNPDWLNIMIFYHVIAHIDFFQNNILFENTWNDDFVGQALADKRMIAALRSEHGRWVDYIVEFSRSIDNLNGYFDRLALKQFPASKRSDDKLSFYFDTFLQSAPGVTEHDIYREIELYNNLIVESKEHGEANFYAEVRRKYPEFNEKFKKYSEQNVVRSVGVMEFVKNNSPFLQRDERQWMKTVMDIVHTTALYFEPQIRTKIINEGWASFWHDELFRKDDRISGHEVDYARVNAGVTSISRVGLNPYAIGLRLIQYVEELADKGKLSFDFQEVQDIVIREEYDLKTGKGRDSIFELRTKFSDFTLINSFVDQDFIDKHDLFVVGQRLIPDRQVYQYYVKSRKGEDYKQMLIDSLYHPPKIWVDMHNTRESNLYLVHDFEGKQLYKNYIQDTMIGLEYLWGDQVQLETTEIVAISNPTSDENQEYDLRRVVYTCKDRKVTKGNL